MRARNHYARPEKRNLLGRSKAVWVHYWQAPALEEGTDRVTELKAKKSPRALEHGVVDWASVVRMLGHCKDDKAHYVC